MGLCLYVVMGHGVAEFPFPCRTRSHAAQARPHAQAASRRSAWHLALSLSLFFFFFFLFPFPFPSSAPRRRPYNKLSSVHRGASEFYFLLISSSSKQVKNKKYTIKNFAAAHDLWRWRTTPRADDDHGQNGEQKLSKISPPEAPTTPACNTCYECVDPTRGIENRNSGNRK